MMIISDSMKSELNGGTDNIHDQCRHIDQSTPDITIQTDSSTLGWGLVFQQTQVGGRWTTEEKLNHINVLEMMAIFFALKALSSQIVNRHVRVLSDSSTAVCYVNNMGGKSVECNKISKKNLVMVH